MGALATSVKRFLSSASVGASQMSAFFTRNQHLHTSRFSRLHEHAPLLVPELKDVQTALLLGVSHLHQTACVRPVAKRAELGNMLVCAPPRMGKSLLAISQLLTWPHSVIVNDVKGELYAATAGYRKTLGPVFVLDPTGFGHRYDPLTGKTTEDELYSAATQLLYEVHEGDGKIFTLRASEMLMLIWLAARIEGIAPFAYLRFLTRLGPEGTAARLQSLSPDLATQFLYTDFAKATFDDRFFLSCWGTLTARLRPMLTETVIRTLTGSDFRMADLLLSEKPITVYMRWREQDILALSPLNRLLWSSSINELTSTYDARQGRGCQPVLLLIDEGGRTAIPNLHDAASTVCGRGVSIWLAIQSLDQLSAVYGWDWGNVLRANCDTQLFYRPNLDETTAAYLEKRLGDVSAYARSQTLRDGDATSEALSERPVPLLTSQEIGLMTDEEVLIWHRNFRPLKLKRMNWQEHPLLVKRRSIPAPPVAKLPTVTEDMLRATTPLTTASTGDEDEDLLNPGDFE